MTDDLDVELYDDSLDGTELHPKDLVNDESYFEILQARKPRDQKQHGRSTTRARVPTLLLRVR